MLNTLSFSSNFCVLVDSRILHGIRSKVDGGFHQQTLNDLAHVLMASTFSNSGNGAARFLELVELEYFLSSLSVWF